MKDQAGIELRVGDAVAYAGRRGSWLWLRLGLVQEVTGATALVKWYHVTDPGLDEVPPTRVTNRGMLLRIYGWPTVDHA